VKVKGLSGPAT